MDRPLNLDVAADQRVDLAGGGLFIEVYTVVAERVLRLAATGLFLTLIALVRAFLLGPCDRALSRTAWRLCNAVANEVDCIQPGHVLQLQEIHRVAFALAEQGDEHVGSRHLVAPAALHMDGGTLHNTLEACCRLRITRPVRRQS